jgi:preprotein translocase subunit YajC
MNPLTPEVLNLLAAAPTQGGQQQGGAPGGVMLGYMVLFMALMYFMIFRPQQKRQKEHEAMVGSLKTGDKVVAAGGIYGIITNVKDDIVTLRIADNVKIEVQKASVTTVTKASDEKKES